MAREPQPLLQQQEWQTPPLLPLCLRPPSSRLRRSSCSRCGRPCCHQPHLPQLRAQGCWEQCARHHRRSRRQAAQPVPHLLQQHRRPQRRQGCSWRPALESPQVLIAGLGRPDLAATICICGWLAWAAYWLASAAEPAVPACQSSCCLTACLPPALPPGLGACRGCSSAPEAAAGHCARADPHPAAACSKTSSGGRRRRGAQC